MLHLKLLSYGNFQKR